jgi:hypothetical protein
MNEMTVRVDRTVHGLWEIAMPDERAPLMCKTLEEASRVAYRCAADRWPCELIVLDAYHRVLRHEQIGMGGLRRRRPSEASPLS